MTIQLELPDDLAKRVAQSASSLGKDSDEFIIGAIEAQLREQLLEPIRTAFRESGMTEDEAVELFEAEKHAMRRGE